MQEQSHTQHLQRTTIQPRFFSEKKIVIFLIVAFVIFLVGYILRLLTPPAPVPIQENSWSGITPGYSNAQQVIENLGTPLSSFESAEGTVLNYQSNFPSMPNQVIVGNNNTVSFMKEFVVYDVNHKLQQYTDQFGNPDLELFGESLSNSVKAYVFLEEGLVIIAHLNGQGVEQKWYFTPTDEQTFLQSWGESLTSEEHGPEPFRL